MRRILSIIVDWYHISLKFPTALINIATSILLQLNNFPFPFIFFFFQFVHQWCNCSPVIVITTERSRRVQTVKLYAWRRDPSSIMTWAAWLQKSHRKKLCRGHWMRVVQASFEPGWWQCGGNNGCQHKGMIKR